MHVLHLSFRVQVDATIPILAELCPVLTHAIYMAWCDRTPQTFGGWLSHSYAPQGVSMRRRFQAVAEAAGEDVQPSNVQVGRWWAAGGGSEGLGEEQKREKS